MSTTDVAVPDEDVIVGLEDLDDSDLVMPRLKIVGPEAVFEDTLSGEKYAKLNAILLGLVKGRVLWHPDVEDDAVPLCKSYNFDEGHADPKTFPWEASGFDKTAVDADDPVLPCGSCPLATWGTHPKNDTPWCSEQHTFPLLVVAEDGSLSAAMLTLQRSGIKASKAYTSSFRQKKLPLFTAVTQLTLTPHKRGTVHYATPNFAKIGDTDQSLFPEFATQFRAIRDFIQTPRKRSDDEDTASSAPPAGAAPAVVSDDDEPPW